MARHAGEPVSAATLSNAEVKLRAARNGLTAALRLLDATSAWRRAHPDQVAELTRVARDSLALSEPADDDRHVPK